MSKKKVVIRSAYSEKLKVYAPVPEKPDGKTQQHEKDSCDIDKILQKYSKQGTLTVNALPPQYGDFSQVVSYQDALDAALAVEEKFGELPSRIRTQFDNNPQKLINFLNNPDNLSKAQEMGLAVKPDPVVEPAAEAPEAPSEPSPAPTV